MSSASSNNRIENRKRHLPHLPIPAQIQFRHNVARLLHSTMAVPVESKPLGDQELHASERRIEEKQDTKHSHPGLKKIPPYWYPYTTYAKERWLGREMLEVVSTEFRDRSVEYYVRISILRFFNVPLMLNPWK